GAHTLPVPIVRFNEFLADTQRIGQGVVVGASGWETVLENNKSAFTAEFVHRTRFTGAYPTTLSPASFVDQLFTNAGVTPTTSERNAAIAEFGSALDRDGVAPVYGTQALKRRDPTASRNDAAGQMDRQRREHGQRSRWPSNWIGGPRWTTDRILKHLQTINSRRFES